MRDCEMPMMEVWVPQVSILRPGRLQIHAVVVLVEVKGDGGVLAEAAVLLFGGLADCSDRIWGYLCSRGGDWPASRSCRHTIGDWRGSSGHDCVGNCLQPSGMAAGNSHCPGREEYRRLALLDVLCAWKLHRPGIVPRDGALFLPQISLPFWLRSGAARPLLQAGGCF